MSTSIGKDLAAIGTDLMAPVEIGPTSETATGRTYGGAPTYVQRFSGATLAGGAVTLIASGVAEIVHVWGWAEDDSGSKRMMPYSFTTSQADFFVNSSGALQIFTSGFMDGHAYSFTVEYTKT